MPRERWFITLACVAGLLTSSPARAQDSIADRPCDSGPTFVDCLRRGEDQVFRAHRGLAHRRGADLVLTLASGDSAIVSDTVTTIKIQSGADTVIADGYFAIYVLTDIDERSGYFILSMDGYENRGSLLISRRTGWERFMAFGPVLFAPSGRYAAVLIPADAAYWDPSIDVYQVTPDSLISDYHVESPGPFVRGDTLWGPVNGRWADDTLAFDTQETFIRNRGSYWPGKAMLLVKKQTRWDLRSRK